LVEIIIQIVVLEFTGERGKSLDFAMAIHMALLDQFP
jgi:hypothetical protein